LRCVCPHLLDSAPHRLLPRVGQKQGARRVRRLSNQGERRATHSSRHDTRAGIHLSGVRRASAKAEETKPAWRVSPGARGTQAADRQLIQGSHKRGIGLGLLRICNETTTHRRLSVDSVLEGTTLNDPLRRGVQIRRGQTNNARSIDVSVLHLLRQQYRAAQRQSGASINQKLTDGKDGARRTRCARHAILQSNSSVHTKTVLKKVMITFANKSIVHHERVPKVKHQSLHMRPRATRTQYSFQTAQSVLLGTKEHE
jgi:hypothetical protein